MTHTLVIDDLALRFGQILSRIRTQNKTSSHKTTVQKGIVVRVFLQCLLFLFVVFQIINLQRLSLFVQIVNNLLHLLLLVAMLVTAVPLAAFSAFATEPAPQAAEPEFTEEDYNNGLAYLKTCYGADAYTNDELIAMF